MSTLCSGELKTDQLVLCNLKFLFPFFAKTSEPKTTCIVKVALYQWHNQKLFSVFSQIAPFSIKKLESWAFCTTEEVINIVVYNSVLGCSIQYELDKQWIMQYSHWRSDQLDQARSSNRVWLGRYEWSGVVGKVYLGRHHSGFLPEYSWHVKKFK